jgi:mono/diheme cytochrome c family protein
MNIYKTITFKSLLLCVLLNLFGCSERHEHKANISAQELYIEHCASCHKETGKGKFLKGVPPNKYTLLTTEELVKKITNNGANNTKMKIFKSMPKQEARVIALYVKNTLKEK